MQIGSSHISSTYGARSYGGAQRHDKSEEDSGPRPLTGHAGKEATSVSLSPQAQQALAAAAQAPERNEEAAPSERAEKAGTEADVEKAEAKAKDAEKKVEADKKPSPGELTPEQEQEVAQLKARDTEVRAHEQAHVAASGGHANGPITYEYERGPDNQQYAVGGHVSIDTSPVAGEPEKTAQKAETVRRAALAPADPSGADKGIAAKASQMASAARSEMAVQAQDEQAEAKEAADAKREETAEEQGPRATVTASHAMASYAMAA